MIPFLSVFFFISAPPIFTSTPQNISVVMGGTANFSCSAKGHPASTLTWQFNVSFCSFKFYVIMSR